MKNIDRKYGRNQIAKICERDGLNYCEICLAGCMGEAHAPAHRHKMRFYDVRPLKAYYDKNQWLAACQFCHNEIEYNRELSDAIFHAKRGENKYK